MEIIFKIFDDNEALQAKAVIEDDKCVKIKLLFKAPKGQYYSFLNNAGLAFEEQYPQYA